MSAIEQLRDACLKRGARTIKGLMRTFRIFDDDGSRSLNFEEFYEGLKDYGLSGVTQESAKAAFSEMDKDGQGSIDVNEFLNAMKGPMSDERKKVILEAFQKLDKTGDGVVTCADLKGVYNVKYHPKYKDGSKTEEELFKEYLAALGEKDDGKLTRQEFEAYYAGVSASVDNDEYFVLMIRNAFSL